MLLQILLLLLLLLYGLVKLQLNPLPMRKERTDVWQTTHTRVVLLYVDIRFAWNRIRHAPTSIPYRSAYIPVHVPVRTCVQYITVIRCIVR